MFLAAGLALLVKPLPCFSCLSECALLAAVSTTGIQYIPKDINLEAEMP